jgi:hypothetical protein
MKVNTNEINPALISLVRDFNQIIPVDANFFLAPDRTKQIKGIIPFDFSLFRKCWLEPIQRTFPHLAMHEAVNIEVVSSQSRRYLDSQLQDYQFPLILSDMEFSENEEIIRNSIEKKIARYTAYEPEKDNKDDRGEVKSLAYIATQGLLYFCSHDSKAIRLIEKAEEWETNLEGVLALQFYEIIYYLDRMKMGSTKYLRALYKYLYYVSPEEKKYNPDWGTFLGEMDKLYLIEIKKSKGKPTPV